MHKRKRNRILLFLIVAISITAGVAIILSNLSSNIMFFYTPSEVHTAETNANTIKVGGLVKPGSIIHINEGIEFQLTDNKSDLYVRYHGLLPPMFKDSQGIVAQGKLQPNKIFYAELLLTKHDENYKPCELKDKIKSTN